MELEIQNDGADNPPPDPSKNPSRDDSLCSQAKNKKIPFGFWKLCVDHIVLLCKQYDYEFDVIEDYDRDHDPTKKTPDR